MKKDSSYPLIWAAVMKIPKGKVAAYGQIAYIAGLGRQPRLVGYALHNIPDGMDIPWHRVINAQGKISFPKGSRHYERQKKMLKAEGIEFNGEKINLERFGWDPE